MLTILVIVTVTWTAVLTCAASKEAKVHSKDLNKCSMQHMRASFVFGIRGF